MNHAFWTGQHQEKVVFGERKGAFGLESGRDILGECVHINIGNILVLAKRIDVGGGVCISVHNHHVGFRHDVLIVEI